MLLDATLRTILRESRTIAVIGAKDKPGQPVDMVGRYLIEAGYDVRPVHPVRRTVWGMQAYPTIGDVPVDVDIVNVFRAPEHCPAHALEVLALPRLPRLFWMQSGISSPEAGRMLFERGVAVVEDLCLMVEHRRLMAGGLL
ncbi:CoA-binding protein [Nitratidesulfovibrio liaohensis]|uniref:CoA-binding protein n=1 Tax=Nitratidesulfovibrio liaohensis TaxID=2604158 RepID=UPI0014245E08|nr:CoA-binding protein [Nitratidesulfovibrio liaohensis]NHZ48861.1 CoA-binding protein [Nitratidesulfovibrio liaohensis]